MQGADFRLAPLDGGTYMNVVLPGNSKDQMQSIFQADIATCKDTTYQLKPNMGTLVDNPGDIFSSVVLQTADDCTSNYVTQVTKTLQEFEKAVYEQQDSVSTNFQKVFVATSDQTRLRALINRDEGQSGNLIIRSIDLEPVAPLMSADLASNGLPTTWRSTVEENNPEQDPNTSAGAYDGTEAPNQPDSFKDTEAGYHLRCQRSNGAPDGITWARFSFDTSECLGFKYGIQLDATVLVDGGAYLVIQEGEDPPEFDSPDKRMVLRGLGERGPLPVLSPLIWQSVFGDIAPVGTENRLSIEFIPKESKVISIAIVCPKGASGKITFPELRVDPIPEIKNFPPDLPPTPTCEGPAATPFQTLPLYTSNIEPWTFNTDTCNCKVEPEYPDLAGQYRYVMDLLVQQPSSTATLEQRDVMIDPPNAVQTMDIQYSLPKEDERDFVAVVLEYSDACSVEPAWKEIFRIVDFNNLASVGEETLLKTKVEFIPRTTKASFRWTVISRNGKAHIRFEVMEFSRGTETMEHKEFMEGLPGSWTFQELAYDLDAKETIEQPPAEAMSGYDSGTIGTDTGLKLWCSNGLTVPTWAISQIYTTTSMYSILYTLNISAALANIAGNKAAWLVIQQGDEDPHLDNLYDPSIIPGPLMNYHGYTDANQMTDAGGTFASSPIEYVVTKAYPGTGDNKLSISLVCGPGTDADVVITKVDLTSQG